MTMKKAPPSNQEPATSARHPPRGRREMDFEMTPMTMDEVVQTQGSSRARYLDLLSRLLLSDSAGLNTSHIVSDWDEEELTRFFAFADLHHVPVRGVEALQRSSVGSLSGPREQQCALALAKEQARISYALNALEEVCEALESAGCSAIVIKSLDHLPDIGSDLDLYTSGGQEQIVR